MFFLVKKSRDEIMARSIARYRRRYVEDECRRGFQIDARMIFFYAWRGVPWGTGVGFLLVNSTRGKNAKLLQGQQGGGECSKHIS